MSEPESPQRIPGGFARMPHRIAADPDLSDGAKVIYLGLLRFARDRGECRPTNARLSEATGGRSPDATLRALKELQTSGLVELSYPPGRPDRRLIRLIGSESLAAPAPEPGARIADPIPAQDGTPLPSVRDHAANSPQDSVPQRKPPIKDAEPIPRSTVSHLRVNPEPHSAPERNPLPRPCGYFSAELQDTKGVKVAEESLKEGNQESDRKNSGPDGLTDEMTEGSGQIQGDFDPPPRFEAFCQRIDRLLAGRAGLCGGHLRGAWLQDPRVPLWWAEFGEHAWRDALDFLAGLPPGDGRSNLRYFLRVVEGKARDERERREAARSGTSPRGPVASGPAPRLEEPLGKAYERVRAPADSVWHQVYARLQAEEERRRHA